MEMEMHMATEMQMALAPGALDPGEQPAALLAAAAAEAEAEVAETAEAAEAAVEEVVGEVLPLTAEAAPPAPPLAVAQAGPLMAAAAAAAGGQGVVVGAQSLRVAQLRGMLETLRAQASALRRVITVDARRIADAGRHGYGDGTAFVGDSDRGSTAYSAVGADIAFRHASMDDHGPR